MPLSTQMLRLKSRWDSGAGWPKRLNWIQIRNLRGWDRQQFDINFPIMAIVGENGCGKSTVLHSAASVYRADDPTNSLYAFKFFPDTAWERITDAAVDYEVEENKKRYRESLRRLKPRWRGNQKRRI